MKQRSIIIGVMGSSHGEIPIDNSKKAALLGKSIADKGCILLTGGCGGLPQTALMSAAKAGGHTMMISPARDAKEHAERYNSPVEYAQEIIFTGFGDLGRTIINIRTSDILVFLQGGAGTLCEFGQSLGEKKFIGVLKNTGGVADQFQQLEKTINHSSKIIYEEDPEKLIEELLKWQKRS